MLACLLFSFNRQFNVFFNLWRIDDWKPRIKKIKIWQVNWREQVELLKRRLIKELRIIDVINSIISLKWLCQTLTPDYFQHLNTCLFSKLVSHNIKVRSHLQVCYLGFSRCRQTVARDSYKWVSYKKSFGCRLVLVNGGGHILAGSGWWWIYFGWWWVVVGDGGYFGWWWMVA